LQVRKAKAERMRSSLLSGSKEAGKQGRRVGVRLLLAKNFASERFFTCTCGTIYAKVKSTLKISVLNRWNGLMSCPAEFKK
jgi:hypothetical protein